MYLNQNELNNSEGKRRKHNRGGRAHGCPSYGSSTQKFACSKIQT